MPPTEAITLHVLANGNVIYDGKEYSLQELKTLNNPIDHQVRVLKHLNVALDKVTVILRGDSRCEIGRILDVVEWCQGLSLTRFVYRTRHLEQ
jgi:hypothetical protein